MHRDRNSTMPSGRIPIQVAGPMPPIIAYDFPSELFAMIAAGKK